MSGNPNCDSRSVAVASPIYNAANQANILSAISRLENDLRAQVPHMAEQVIDWMRNLTGSGRPEDRLIAPEMFPMFLLPWWLNQSLSNPSSAEFQSDLIYSTMNGYYYIRLIDNLMDHETTCELEILPVAGFFHTQFQLIYQGYFEEGHPFWQDFRRHWFDSADFAIRDAELAEIDRATFEKISAKKICAAKIPLAAVCHLTRQSEMLPAWLEFCNELGCFQQMLDDMTDWITDSVRGEITTYFLSEAKRARQPDETVSSWVIREGFGWGIEQLNGSMANLTELNRSLLSRDVERYLDVRKEGMGRWRDRAEKGLAALDALGAIFEDRIETGSE